MSDLFTELSDLSTPYSSSHGESYGRAVRTPPPIPHALAIVTTGATIEYCGLAVTPLVGSDDPACDYFTLDEHCLPAS